MDAEKKSSKHQDLEQEWQRKHLKLQPINNDYNSQINDNINKKV